MRARILIGLIFINYFAAAQDKMFRKHFDSLWQPVSGNAAFYYADFYPQDTLYNCISYRADNGKLFAKSVYADTLFTKPRGLQVRYYETGLIQDSSLYNLSGTLTGRYHYYPNGILQASYTYDLKTKKETSAGFDKNGKTIPGFVYMKDAEFPGGDKFWQDFLQSTLNNNIPVKNNAPAGTYNVVVVFIVDKTGKVVDVKPETAIGYGMEEEVVRVLKKSPRWIPGSLMGEKVSVYRKQPVIFKVKK